MKKSMLAGVAIAALYSSSAMAADLRTRPVYTAPPPVLVYYNWTGCNLGGHIGGLWARKAWIERTPGDIAFGQSLGGHDADSGLGGVQAGCDYHFASGFVIGIQGDYAWTAAEGSKIDLLDPEFTNRSRIKSLATVTGRIGYGWQRFLGYVKIGGAWERDNYEIIDRGATRWAANETRSGWTVGVGAEYAFANYLSGFVEYNYYDFGTNQNTFKSFFGGGTTFIDVEESKSVLRAGLNLRFGGWGGAPVVGRY
jgi:outer membrane immunogenic protein